MIRLYERVEINLTKDKEDYIKMLCKSIDFNLKLLDAGDPGKPFLGILKNDKFTIYQKSYNPFNDSYYRLNSSLHSMFCSGRFYSKNDKTVVSFTIRKKIYFFIIELISMLFGMAFCCLGLIGIVLNGFVFISIVVIGSIITGLALWQHRSSFKSAKNIFLKLFEE